MSQLPIFGDFLKPPHWVLDVTFREDESRIRKDAAPENFAMLRHVALNLLKSEQTWEGSIKRKRQKAALEDNYREIPQTSPERWLPWNYQDTLANIEKEGSELDRAA